MAEKRVDIIFGARNEAAGATDDLKSDLDEISQRASGAGGSFIEMGAKFLAATGSIEAGAKGLTSAVRLLRGDTEGALEALEQLPFGVGPAVAAVRDLVGELGNIKTAMEEIAEAQALNVQRLDEIAERRRLLTADSFGRRVLEASAGFRDERDALLGEMHELRLDELKARDRLDRGSDSMAPGVRHQLEQEAAQAAEMQRLKERELVALNALETDTIAGIESDRVGRRMQAAMTAEAQFQQEASGAFDEMVKQSLDEISGRLADFFDPIAADAERQRIAADERAAIAEQRRLIQFESRQQDLIASGRSGLAQREQIEESFRQRLAGVDDPGLRGDIEQLRDRSLGRAQFEAALAAGNDDARQFQEAMKLVRGEAAGGGDGQRSALTGESLSNTFTGAAELFALGRDPAVDTARNTEELVKEAKATREGLKMLADAIKTGNVKTFAFPF